MKNKLFVIGNGFDLHHNIPSKYSNFGEFCKFSDPKVYDLITNYLFVDGDFWNYFEDRLSTFDEDSVIDHASNFLVSYGAEDWRDRDHHAFEYEIEQIVDGLSIRMRSRFAEWIRALPISTPGHFSPVRCIDRSASYLTFNYTPTLQQVYGVPDANVLHIHGKASAPDEEIILGHGWERVDEDKLSTSIDEDTDIRVAGGYQLIDSYFARTFKPSELIVTRNRAWFDSLKGISEIFVLGHSLADVDAIYFHEIVKQVGISARWIVSYHGDDNEARQRISAFGVPETQAAFVPLSII